MKNMTKMGNKFKVSYSVLEKGSRKRNYDLKKISSDNKMC